MPGNRATQANRIGYAIDVFALCEAQSTFSPRRVRDAHKRIMRAIYAYERIDKRLNKILRVTAETAEPQQPPSEPAQPAQIEAVRLADISTRWIPVAAVPPDGGPLTWTLPAEEIDTFRSERDRGRMLSARVKRDDGSSVIVAKLAQRGAAS